MSSCYLRYTTYDLAQHRRTMERNVIRRRARSGPVPSATKSLLGDLPTDSSLDEWSSYRFLDSETGYPRWLQQPCGEGLVEWSSRLHNPLSSKKQLPPQPHPTAHDTFQKQAFTEAIHKTTNLTLPYLSPRSRFGHTPTSHNRIYYIYTLQSRLD